MTDPWGAFVPGPDIRIKGAAGGILGDVAFAAKDLYDVAGHVTGCGNPDWARTHEPAAATASAIEALLNAGATLVGKTITDELAYSLIGRNAHYGTPKNTNAPGRIPGGSSSGSAAAVAGGGADIALGTDTGGSVRVPASHCGLFGIRPTYGRISLTGVMPLTPSLDTVGWFARDAALLRRAGDILLGDDDAERAEPCRLIVAEDAAELLDDGLRPGFAAWVERLEARLGRAERLRVGEPGGGLDAWMRHFRVIQAHEVWQVHGGWIDRVKPKFGPDIAASFEWVRSVCDGDEVEPAQTARPSLAAHMDALVRPGTVVCLPTTPGIAPPLDISGPPLLDHRLKVLSLTCLAGLAGLPQITLPLLEDRGCPAGLSLIGAKGSDRDLLGFVEALSNGRPTAIPAAGEC